MVDSLELEPSTLPVKNAVQTRRDKQQCGWTLKDVEAKT